MPALLRRSPRLLACACALSLTAAAAAERLDLALLQVELPGPPVEVFAGDLDHDGVSDLLVLVAYTTWDQIAVSEEVEMDEADGLIEMMTVVPALADRRRLFLLRGRSDGGFDPPARGHAIPEDVVAFVRGPPTAPVLALDREGLSAVRLDAGADGPEFRYQRLLRRPSVLAPSRALLPNLPLSADVDGDGVLDLLYPMPHHYEVFAGSSAGFTEAATGLEPAARVALPPPEELELGPRRMHYPLPRFQDLDGDGLPELVVLHPRRRVSDPWIATNLGSAAFGELQRPMGGEARPEEDGVADGEPHLVYLGDIDGDGRAEYFEEQLLSNHDAGFREEMREAKEPPYRYRILPMDEGYRPGEPGPVIESVGYAFGIDSDSEFPLPGGFQDLDGDGRQDLVTITLDFSMMQLVRVMVTQSISIGLDFHIRCQQPDGSFRRVEGLDLSGKFKIRLNDLRLGELSQFAGDFDGDGRADFVQLGRGRRVSIHRGGPGCTYPRRPDLSFDLREEPRNLSLVQVRDLDGDGLADLMVVQPRAGRGRTRAADEEASTLPVTLEMHLSRGARR